LASLALAGTILCGMSLTASAEGFFNRIASFPVNTNLPASMDQKIETSAEIITATKDGNMLIYSDSPLGAIGIIDITDPANPKPASILKVEGEPTAVAVSGDYVVAGINTSESYTVPSGSLAVISLADKTQIGSCDLGGQPDSVAVSPDGSIIAVAIENERDEDLNDGAIPQMPGGSVMIFKTVSGQPDCDTRIVANIDGLAEIAPQDPEAEFVDINANNEIAVTLQENNHIIILNGNDGSVISHFSAGAVDLKNVDVAEEGALTFDASQNAVKREPDAVQWLDNDRIVIANEGDYEGGSRGFTIFSKTGEVLFESGLDFEYRVAMAGHYPEKRSGNKGVEPEGLEVAEFNGSKYIFVLSERGSVIGVYKDTGGAPEFVQLMPSGLGPEGAVAIPSRNLLAVSNEVDLIEDGGVRSHVTLYQGGFAAADYPMIMSGMDANGRPVGFGALSGLVADSEKPGILYAVNDSFFAMQPSIFTIDANQKPAMITSALPVTRNGANAQLLDLEGITTDGEGGFWLASEGRTDRMIPHGIYNVDAKGAIKKSIPFPAGLLAVEKRFGAEGITKVGDTLWIAIQREWGDDPKDMVKLVAYNTKTEEWGAVHYLKAAVDVGWTGLSEITSHGDFVYVIERDNQIGDAAKIKKLYRIALGEMVPAPLGGELPVVAKEEVRDFIPDLKSTNGYMVDKLEGFAIDAAGNAFAVTDNDGVDDSNGETLFMNLGAIAASN